MRKKIIIEIISMVTGIMFTGSGSFLVYNYIQNVISSLGSSDQSVIFWHLPIMFIGTALFGAGIYFNIIAYKSFKGNKNATNLIKTSLKSLGIIIMFIIFIAIFNNLLF